LQFKLEWVVIEMRVLCLSVFLLAISACGGGGGGGTGSPPTTVSPPITAPPPTPSGISFYVDGAATKGIVLGGDVRIIDANDPSNEIAVGTTSTIDGSFDLLIGNGKGFEGGIVKVIVTVGGGAVMVCDAPSGCYGTPFGGKIRVSEGFELTALVDAPVDGGQMTVNVTAVTTLATKMAELNADNSLIDATSIAVANSQVAQLFGFESTDLTRFPSIDITKYETGDNVSFDALRAAYINAGLLEAMLEGTGRVDQRFDALLTDFTENAGKFIVNEKFEDLEQVSLEDIISGAYYALEESPLVGETRGTLSNRLGTDYVAISAVPQDTRTAGLPDPIVEPPLILAEEVGVSFSHFPSKSILQRDIMISDNVGQSLKWSATSNASWLSVTASGEAGGILVLQADPAGLAPGQLYATQVEVNAADPAVDSVEHINVGLWVNDKDPAARVQFSVFPFKTKIVADPVRPYLYTHSTGYDVDIVNVYTGETVGVIADISWHLDEMSISPNGDFLYVYDATKRQVFPINLSTLTVNAEWDANILDSMVVRRIKGRDILFTGIGRAFDAETGTEITPDTRFYTNTSDDVAVSKNGKTLCLLTRATWPYTLACFELFYSPVDGGRLAFVHKGWAPYVTTASSVDVAVSDDGSLAYAAVGPPLEFSVFETETMSKVQALGGSTIPSAVEVGPNGIFYAGNARASSGADIQAYDQAGNVLASYGVFENSGDSMPSRLMAISGDGSRLIVVVTNETGVHDVRYIAILSTH
jgi:hypothetical protein